jgi:hypothetical protein
MAFECHKRWKSYWQSECQLRNENIAPHPSVVQIIVSVLYTLQSGWWDPTCRRRILSASSEHNFTSKHYLSRLHGIIIQKTTARTSVPLSDGTPVTMNHMGRSRHSCSCPLAYSAMSWESRLIRAISPFVLKPSSKRLNPSVMTTYATPWIHVWRQHQHFCYYVIYRTNFLTWNPI